jgi:hypothetical protein
MQNSFTDRHCPKCSSTDLVHFVAWISGTIPSGIEGEIACRNCLYWETLLTTAPAQSVFDVENWTVLEAGQGLYSTEAERAQIMTYQDPRADRYQRHKG